MDQLHQINYVYPENVCVNFDEWPFTHHFKPEKATKMTKNTQKDHIILQILLECVFMCFKYKRIENKAKVDKTELEWEKEQNGAFLDQLDII